MLTVVLWLKRNSMMIKRLYILALLLLCSFYSKSNISWSLYFSVEKYDIEFQNQLVNRFEIPAKEDLCYLKTATGDWLITTKKDRNEAFTDYYISFQLLEGEEKAANVGLRFSFVDWNEENYVLLPSAAYNGNRFDWRRISYSPKLLDPRDIKKDGEMIISDVPRLTKGKGLSRIQERSGSMSIPSFLFYSPIHNRSFALLTNQSNEWGDYGYTIEENYNRSKAVFSLRSPIVREHFKYNIADNMDVTPDKPADFNKGDKVDFYFRIYDFKSDSLSELFDKYLIIRHDLVKPNFNAIYPFSECFSTIEKKFNTQNFVEKWGYYSVGMRDMFLQDWQIGWTGGMISTYPLLFAGNKITQANVIRNFEWLFDSGISPSGFFWDCGEGGNKWYGGDIRKPHTANWHLIRKSGDALYYILKQFDLMALKGIEVPEDWKIKTKRVADSFVNLWYKNNQFGQFVDSETAEIIVGGSTSGAIIPAALVLAYNYFNELKYLQVAESSAKYMYEKYVKYGITSGGPGDALQNCDSESAYSMLESFVTLYENTNDCYWKQAACDMAALFSTWVMGYSYKFPKGCLFYNLNINTTGAVFANTQNKHGSPGICTHSGVALLKLYRITGNKYYLELLKEIAYNIPQYMSHNDRKIERMPAGWINERVSTTDWFEGIGEIFPGSTWAETSLMLTYIEIPGVYVDLSNNLVVGFDNIDVTLLSLEKDGACIYVKNPTDYDACITIFVDSAKSKRGKWENNCLHSIKYKIKAGEGKKLFVH